MVYGVLRVPMEPLPVVASHSKAIGSNTSEDNVLPDRLDKGRPNAHRTDVLELLSHGAFVFYFRMNVRRAAPTANLCILKEHVGDLGAL